MLKYITICPFRFEHFIYLNKLNKTLPGCPSPTDSEVNKKVPSSDIMIRY